MTSHSSLVNSRFIISLFPMSLCTSRMSLPSTTIGFFWSSSSNLPLSSLTRTAQMKRWTCTIRRTLTGSCLEASRLFTHSPNSSMGPSFLFGLWISLLAPSTSKGSGK
ncbi:hypothetical protein FA15DRAFT_47515 [Coprinopsis marcescibilis]|uniref:Uncharacterized protein n=1 Tax=Coprinopsis marcescibilis TaxID=230819 RepID=A0A5C3KQS7_COPMA|nr:hypothetical protein FA15DRAFT_47515 [Coprinopsis marcescibilis]